MDNAWLLTTIDLPAGSVTTLRPRARTIIECDRGVLWVTAAGDPVDHFVEPGAAVDLREAALVVVEALGDARVQVRTATPAVRRQAPSPLRHAARRRSTLASGMRWVGQVLTRWARQVAGPGGPATRGSRP